MCGEVLRIVVKNGRKSTKRSLLVLVLIPIVVVFCVTLSHSQYYITQLTHNTSYDDYPQINDDGYVVWNGCGTADCSFLGDGGFEIFLYNGTSTTQLTNDTYNDRYPQINNNGHVVWQGGFRIEYVGGWWMITSYYDIFLYNGTSTIQLTDNDYHDQYPQISDTGHVVWCGDDGSDYEIFLYDGTSTTQLTDNPYDDGYPQINNNGYVVWFGWDGSDYEIFLYDGTSTTQLTDNAYDDGFEMSDNSYDQVQINDSGYVVWHGKAGLYSDIFLSNGMSTTQLTDNSFEDNWPQINDHGYVVWCGDGEIYLYDGTSTAQLTSDNIFDFPAQINNNGYLVWSGWDGPGPDQAEIFLAVPCSDADGDGYYLESGCPAPLDCDDADSDVNPGMTEIPLNSIDENCDGWDCFIATAALGTEMEGKIDVLRSFRDTYLLDNAVGQTLLGVYYKYSPPIATHIVEHRWMKTLIRTLLLPVIGLVSLFV